MLLKPPLNNVSGVEGGQSHQGLLFQRLRLVQQCLGRCQSDINMSAKTQGLQAEHCPKLNTVSTGLPSSQPAAISCHGRPYKVIEIMIYQTRPLPSTAFPASKTSPTITVHVLPHASHSSSGARQSVAFPLPVSGFTVVANQCRSF